MAMRTLTFFKHFVTAPAQVGAIIPSSKELAAAVTHYAGVADASVVVEYGAGTGVITEAIFDTIPSGATFISIELVEEFVEIVRKRLPRVDVIHDSAVNTREHLKTRGCTHCDCVVSGLPWTTFPEELQNALLDSTLDVLRPGGVFATYMYLQSNMFPSALRFLGKLRSRFSTVNASPIIWKNVPPARVYYAHK